MRFCTFVFLFLVLLLCASVSDAALIYEFISSGVSLAEIEFSSLPVGLALDEIVRFNLTATGKAVFGLGLGNIEFSFFDFGTSILEDGLGLKGDVFAGLLGSEFSVLGSSPIFSQNNELLVLFASFSEQAGSDILFLENLSENEEKGREGDWQAIPEPSTLVLLALGFAGIIGLSYRQQHRKSTAA